MTTNDQLAESERIAALLAEHWPHPVFGCECMPEDPETGAKDFLEGSWERHVADLLTRPGVSA